MRYVHASDGVRLGATIFVPRTPRRGAFLLVHGFSQNRHAFVRGHLPRTLLQAGYAVLIAELRGHGLSERPPRWTLKDHLEQDLPALAVLARKWAGSGPLHYLGHSMGGILGFASLARSPGWASVTGLASPLELGRGSPLVGLAARVATPLSWLAGDRPVPMDRFLGALSGVLSWGSAPLPLRGLQRLVALANPRAADPEAIRDVLRSSDPESMAVFQTFLRAARGRSVDAEGASLTASIRSAREPLAAVVGGQDIFAPPPSVDLLATGRHAGPRRVVALPRSSHVDLTVGEDVARAVRDLLPFLEPP